MKKSIQTWALKDFAYAMENAIYSAASPRFIRKKQDKIYCNGFWRNGDKQNVCVWLDNASFHDAKTGESGGCKEFARVAFNMSLADFMTTYSPVSNIVLPIHTPAPSKPAIDNYLADLIWQSLEKTEPSKEDLASEWLINNRGIDSPRRHISCGFLNLAQSDLKSFNKVHHSFINHRLSLGPQIIVPLRGHYSGKVKNLFFRSLTNVSKEEKSRLLPNVGGFTEPDGSPRAFGFPHLYKEFPNIILCEGMADYFAVEFLLNGNESYLPIGASNADGLVKWASFLLANNYQGHVYIIFQLDNGETGQISTKGIGQAKAIEAMRMLKEGHIPANFFDWPFYLHHTTTHPSEVNDIADSLSTELRFKECSIGHLQEIFLLSLKEQKRQ